MKIDEVKTIEDILTFMNDNIEYGYIDINGEKHVNELKGFENYIKLVV